MSKKAFKTFVACASLCALFSLDSFAWTETTSPIVPTTSFQQSADTSAEETTFQPTEQSTPSGFVNENGNLYYYIPESSNKLIPGNNVYKLNNKAYLFSETGEIIQYDPNSPITEFNEKKYLLSSDNSLISSFQTIDGSTYYFDEKSYEMKKGWVAFPEGKRYFNEKTGTMHTGFADIGEYTYYFDEDGIMQTGWVEFEEGKRRFHLETGAMLRGFKSFEGSSYYFDEDGIMQTGWIKFKSGKRHFNLDTGAMLKGKKAVNGKYYYFNKKGFMKRGWATTKGEKYFFRKKNGVMVTGWRKIKGKYYHFKSDGKMSRNEIIENVYLLNNGTIAQSKAVKQAVRIINSVTNDNMTQEEKLYACYNWIVRNCAYERDYSNPSVMRYNWPQSFAEYCFTYKKGNCYKYASAMGYCAAVLGYNAKVAYGKISYGRTTSSHGWTEVILDKKKYILDTVQEDYSKGSYFLNTYSTNPKKLTKYASRAIVLS